MGAGGLLKLLPELFGEFSKNKYQIPVKEMTRVLKPTHQIEKKIINPEDMQGTWVAPAVGDKSALGILEYLNDVKLDYPVNVDAGSDFMRSAAQKEDQAIWASANSRIGKLKNQTIRNAEKNVEGYGSGLPTHLLYQNMGARGVDFAKFTADTILAQMNNTKILKKDIKEFDKVMKEKFKDWSGIKSPNIREEILSNTEKRKTFIETAGSSKWQNKGFPNIESTRWGVTETDLVGVPNYYSGRTIGLLDPNNLDVINPKFPHTTYDTEMRGIYKGGLLDTLPRSVAFPKFMKRKGYLNPATTPSEQAISRAFDWGTVSEFADQEWVDGVMGYLENLRSFRDR